MLKELGAALAVFVLILAGAVMIWREKRAEKRRQERLGEAVDQEGQRQYRMRVTRNE